MQTLICIVKCYNSLRCATFIYLPPLPIDWVNSPDTTQKHPHLAGDEVTSSLILSINENNGDE